MLISSRYILGASLVYGGCYYFAYRAINAPFDAYAEEIDKAVQMVKSQEEDEEEIGFFIPFLGTTKMVQPGPYSGSDPEWQEFIKFSKDKELGEKVRGMLLLFFFRYGCA